MWENFFRDGGFGMYPTSIFGFVLVAAGVLYLIKPERRYGAIVANAMVATGLSGVLGTAVGLITTFRYVQSVEPDKQVAIALLGGAESLNNLVLAMILCVLTSLLALLATVRAARSSSGGAA